MVSKRNPILFFFLLVFFAVILLNGSTRPVPAQEGQNWLQVVVNGQLEIKRLTGGTQFLPYPLLQAEFTNTLSTPYNVYVVGGDLLKPATAGYCTLILADERTPLAIPVGDYSAELPAYCLELPNDPNGRKPDELAQYAPINYAGNASELSAVLGRARDAGLVRDFATQLAIWQLSGGQSLEQLSTLIGQDLSAYAPVLAHLVEGAPLPEPTLIPTAAPINTVQAAPVAIATQAPEQQQEEQPQSAETNTAQTNWLPLALAAVGGLALLGGGFYILQRRKEQAARVAALKRRKRPTMSQYDSEIETTMLVERSAMQKKNDTNAIKTGPTRMDTGAKSETGGNSANKGKCLICGESHETRDCPNIQRPNQAFVPTEVELTLANVDEAPSYDHDASPSVPEIDPFLDRHGLKPHKEDGTWYLEPLKGKRTKSTVDQEFFQAAKDRSTPSADKEMPTDTSPALVELSETGGVQRKHVTYLVREKGKPEVLGSLGDDGGVVSRISLKNQQLLIPPRDVSTPHAFLRLRPDGNVTIKDLRSKNGTFVYDERLESGVVMELQNGAIIRFGDSAEFELDIPNRKLVARDPSSISRDLSSSEQWLITRRNLHSIVIRNSQISTPHLLIRPSEEAVNEIRLKDLHSHNPTLIEESGENLAECEFGSLTKTNSIDLRIGDKVYTIQARSQNKPDKIGDHYKVLEQIYVSKMADVYSVQDTRHTDQPRLVAKLLNVHQEKVDSARAAFETEILLMQSLNTPQILPCLGIGHDANHNAPFFVMPYLEGADMRRIMLARRKAGHDGGLRLADIHAILDTLTDAVEQIHAQGYAHCDIKPANVFVSPDGEIYLLDLGVATPVGQHAEFFTPFYSAPEVGAKQLPPVTEASDVYSLGVMLYELLTGQEAKELIGKLDVAPEEHGDTEQSHSDPNARETLERHLRDSRYGLEFLEVIHTAMQYLAENRYPTSADFREAFNTAYLSAQMKATMAGENTQADLVALAYQAH